MTVLLISVQPGEEVMESVARQLKEHGVENGAVVSLIGAIDACCISTMPKHDANQDILTEYEQPFELSGTGEIKNGILHLHCVLAKEGDMALAGHLHWARVETFFVNAYVIET
ncbi:MAG: PPC domain-containing DNA-binding protein [Pseudonocardiales bacterium]